MKSSSLFTAVFAALALSIHSHAQTNPAVPASSKPRPVRTAESTVTPAVKNPERHAKFVTQAKAGKCGVLFLGDSITDFWPRFGKDSWARFSKYDPLDFGISGDHTENVLWRITDGELDGINPKAVILMIGTNNEGHYKDKPEWVAAGIKKIIDTVQTKLPNTKILLFGIFPRDTAGSENRKLVNQVNEIIKNFADGQKVRYMDIGSKFLDANGEIPQNIMKDKLHPGPEGYRIWADAILPALDEMMK